MSRESRSLVARVVELAALEQELHCVRGQGSRLVLVSGRPGTGKTTLVDAFLTAHADDALRARAARWEAGRPHAVLHQLVGEPAPGEATDPLDAAARLAHAAGADRDEPRLLVVDDAQWADGPSLQALDSLVRHHPRAKVLVVLVGDADEAAADPATLDLLRRGATTLVELRPLTPGEVGEVAAARGLLLHPSAAERLCAHTGGTVGHVVALVDQAPRATWSTFAPDLPAPAAVAARVRAALRACSSDARALAHAAAVLGRATPAGVVARLAGVDETFGTALEEATGSGLVAPGPTGPAELRPTDPMVRAAVLDAMGPAEVARWSRRAAEVVTDRVHRLHLLVAASPLPDPTLADELDEAAGASAAQGAWGTAATLLIDAGRLTEEPLLRELRLTRAVDALVGAGDALGAAALAPELESLRETPMRNAVLGYLAILRGRATEAENRLDRAWSLVNAEREPDVAASICQRYVLHHLARCCARELVLWADRAVALSGPDDPSGVEAQAIRGLGLPALGRLDEAVATYRDLTDRVPSGAQLQRVTMGRGWLALVRGEVQDARADLESAVPTTFHGGSARISLWARAWLARAQFLLGDWDTALQTVAQGVELLEHTGIVLTGPLLRWTAVQVHALRGEWAAAEETLRELDASTQEYEIMRVPTCLARASLAEARADYDGVLRALHPLTGFWAHDGVDDPGQWPWQDVYANALVVEGHLEEAERFLAPREERARARGQQVALARLGYARGRLLGVRGDLGAARRVFEESLATFEGRPLRYDRARVGFAYGQTLRRAGRRRDADTVISAARDLFAALGARTYAARCDRELKAGGVRAQRTERGVADLTPQEEAVTALVAQGLSNREAATELFLSVKTVQYHLTRVYAKLGIRSRSELAALRSPGGEVDEET